VGALEGLASPANGPIGAAAAGPSTSGNGAVVAASSVGIRELEAGLASARTDLSGTQVSLALVEARIAGWEVREARVDALEARAAEADALEEKVHDLEEGLRSVAEIMG